jgi:hypothetical protein
LLDEPRPKMLKAALVVSALAAAECPCPARLLVRRVSRIIRETLVTGSLNCAAIHRHHPSPGPAYACRCRGPPYWVGAAVADNIWGPYQKQPQVFLGGHIAVFQGPDGKEWFSYRGEAGGKSRGRLCLDPIHFTETGLVAPFLPSTEQVVIPGK